MCAYRTSGWNSFAKPGTLSLSKSVSIGIKTSATASQLRIPAARARERAAFEPVEPCCKRRGVASSRYCKQATSRQQQSAASRPTPSCAAQQQSSRDAASGDRSTLSVREALPPLERRFRNEGTHDRLTQANKLERQHGRTSRRRQRRGPRRPRRLRKRQRRQRPGPRARARARPWWRRVRTRADIIVALTVAIDATHRPWPSTTRRYIERHRHDANWLISTQ